MLLAHLFEKIEPGQRRAIQLQIDKYEKAMAEIERHENHLQSMDYDIPSIPGTEQHFEEMKVAYQKAIDNLKAKLKTDKGSDSFEKYMAAIVKNCPSIVKACKSTGKLLYRGTNEDAPAFYGKPYDERRAKDSNTEVSDAFNAALKAAGAQATRDNSIFTTTSRNLADMFGRQIYIVFPRDPLHFTWSSTEKDLVISTEHMGDMVDPELIKQIMRPIWADDTLREEFIKIFRNEGYINPSNPIELDVENYPNTKLSTFAVQPFSRHGFYWGFKTIEKMLPKLGQEYAKYGEFKNWVSPEFVIKNFGLKIDDDLEGAFTRGYEITIRAEYYAVRLDFEKRVKEYLGMNAFL